MEAVINKERCKNCGQCVEECPNHNIKKGTMHVNHSDDNCDKCLHCYAICPHFAINIVGKEQIHLNNKLNANDLLSHLMMRRSYRSFKDKQLSDKDIKLLLEAAIYIPSGGNDHRLNITVLTDENKRKELLSSINNYYSRILKLLKYPVLRVIAKRIGDPKVKATLNDKVYYRRILNILENLNNPDDPVFYKAPAAFFFHTDRIMPTASEDCLLSAYNLVLFSETIGLGSCFVSLSQQAVTNSKQCKKILSIPVSHGVEAVVVVGYPKKYYKRPALRNSKSVKII